MNITHGLASGQVLQRLPDQTARAAIRGSVAASGPVTASIAGSAEIAERVVGNAQGGEFTATVDGIPVGGPYTLTLRVGEESLTVTDLYAGDVWVLAGQSNMEGVGMLEGALAPDPSIRALYMDGRWDIGRDPLHWWLDSPDSAHQPDPLPPTAIKRMRRQRELSGRGVGPGLFFASEMARRTGVPQGLICTAHGGTSMEQWNPANKHLGGASLYGSMLRMVRSTGQPVAAVLWYQGENETGHISGVTPYTERMVALVQAFRDDFGQPDLPFLMAQLGRFVAVGPLHDLWNRIQALQSGLPDVIGNLLCVATVDLSLDDVIHISTPGNARLGVRFARIADRLVHGNTAELPPPRFVSAVRVTDEERFRTAFFGIDVTFANVSGTLQAAGDPSGFALVDEGYDIRPIIFKTSLRGDVVRIEAAMRDNVEGLKLMYGAGLYPYCNITDGRDMSLPVFGPVAIQETIAMSPYALDWRVSAIQPIDVAITDQQYLPIDDLPSKVRSFPAPFVAMAAELGSNRGRVFFATDLVADEPMDVRLRFGYDGPFRMWVDREVVYTDADGVNPIILDEHQIALRLAQGTHRITCAMDYATGLAWGFALRFDRPDISREQAMAGASLRAEWRAA